MTRVEDDEEILIERLLRSRADQSTQEPGAVVVGHQPWRGPLAHLHIFYSGLGQGGIAQIEAIYGRALPPRLRTFYAKWNGVRLFEGIISIYGLVRRFTRDPEVHNPLDPEIAARCFASFHPAWHRRGYFPIGSVALFTRQAVIACDPTDHVVLLSERDDAALRRYADIFEALAMISAELEPLWDEKGALLLPEEALDQALLRGGSA
jgi:hypothetical protein